MPLETLVQITGLGFSWTQVYSVFNGAYTIALLSPRIWDLVLLEIKRKKYVNVP